MECPICYDYINISCIPSCTHHFCYSCILKWCNKKKIHIVQYVKF